MVRKVPDRRGRRSGREGEGYIRTVFGKIDTDKSGSITIKIPGFLNKADIINFQVFFLL